MGWGVLEVAGLQYGVAQLLFCMEKTLKLGGCMMIPMIDLPLGLQRTGCAILY